MMRLASSSERLALIVQCRSASALSTLTSAAASEMESDWASAGSASVSSSSLIRASLSIASRFMLGRMCLQGQPKRHIDQEGCCAARLYCGDDPDLQLN